MRHWHVAPWVDVCAYAFSWLPLLLAIAFVGMSRQHDYLIAYIVVLSVTDVHRHYGFPYVYMDRQVFARHPTRFVLFPVAMFALFVFSPWLARMVTLSPFGVAALCAAVVWLVQLCLRDRPNTRTPLHEIVFVGLPSFAAGVAIGWYIAPETLGPSGGLWIAFTLFVCGLDLFAYIAHRKVRVLVFPLLAIAAGLVPVFVLAPSDGVSMRHVLNFAAVFAGAWNIWHVYMQKYGIFRMYAAKSRADRPVPGWVDRLLIFAWLPFYFFYLATTYRAQIDRLFSRGRRTLAPLFDFFAEYANLFLVPTALLVVVSVAVWVFYEHRASGLRNRARLTMAVGTTLLASTFVLVDPLKAYLAYAFSHGVEYMVFVWAYQRRRYDKPLAHRPIIQRFLGFPLLTYVGSALVLAGGFIYLKYYGRWIFADESMPRVRQISTYEWVGYWTVFQSMVHFYFDGFLWKMRLPSVRATVGA